MSRFSYFIYREYNTDVYSLGMTAVELFTETEPWADFINAQIVCKVRAIFNYAQTLIYCDLKFCMYIYMYVYMYEY